MRAISFKIIAFLSVHILLIQTVALGQGIAKVGDSLNLETPYIITKLNDGRITIKRKGSSYVKSLWYFSFTEKKQLYDSLIKRNDAADGYFIDFTFSLRDYMKYVNKEKKDKLIFSNCVIDGFSTNEPDSSMVDLDTLVFDKCTVTNFNLDNIHNNYFYFNGFSFSYEVRNSIFSKFHSFNMPVADMRPQKKSWPLFLFWRERKPTYSIYKNIFTDSCSFILAQRDIDIGDSNFFGRVTIGLEKNFSVVYTPSVRGAVKVPAVIHLSPAVSKLTSLLFPSFLKKSLELTGEDTSRVNIRNVNLKRGVSMTLDNKFKVNFTQSNFSDTIFLQNTSSMQNVTLTNNWLSRDSTFIKLPLRSNVSQLKIDPNNLSRVRILFEFDKLTENTYEIIDNNFYKLIQQVSSSKDRNPAVIADCIGWLEYQNIHFKMQYLHENSSFTHWIKYFGYQILEFTVNNGHKGEAKFIRIISLVIILWAFIYFTYFRTEVNNYVAIVNQQQLPLFPGSNKRAYLLIEIFKCFWFSFIILINPKFPASYFKFSHRMLSCLIIEWIIGFILIILFIIYIASKYPFAKLIFGF